MDTLGPSAFARLYAETQAVIPTMKAYAKETRSWREPEEINPEYETERRIAAALLMVMIRDYWAGKAAAKQYSVEEWADLKRLPKSAQHARRAIENGDAAYRWLTEQGEQLKPYTFRTVCELMGRDPVETSAIARHPDMRRTLRENKRKWRE